MGRRIPSICEQVAAALGLGEVARFSKAVTRAGCRARLDFAGDDRSSRLPYRGFNALPVVASGYKSEATKNKDESRRHKSPEG